MMEVLSPTILSCYSLNYYILISFKVLTLASQKMKAFCDDVSCSLVEVDRHLRGVYCLHHQGALMMVAVWASETSLDYMRVHDTVSQKSVICFSFITFIDILYLLPFCLFFPHLHSVFSSYVFPVVVSLTLLSFAGSMVLFITFSGLAFSKHSIPW